MGGVAIIVVVAALAVPGAAASVVLAILLGQAGSSAGAAILPLAAGLLAGALCANRAARQGPDTPGLRGTPDGNRGFTGWCAPRAAA